MPITLRETKGSPLTFNELDGNFVDLQGQLTTAQGQITTAQIDISSLQSSVNSLTPKYKEYVAYIIDTGGGPVETIAINDLGVTPTFARTNTGEYTITANGAFPDFEKVVPMFNPQQGSPVFWNVFYNDANSLGVNIWDSTGTLANLFVGNLIIRIYD